MDIYIYIYVHTHPVCTVEYYMTMKKDETLPLATTWMDLEGIMLSEVSQTEKDKYHMISLIRGNRKKTPNE